jgi:pyruvate kinase
VANAVLDGVDGILLGAETLRGKYPVETVRNMLSICRQAELVFDYEQHFENLITNAMNVRLMLLLELCKLCAATVAHEGHIASVRRGPSY